MKTHILIAENKKIFDEIILMNNTSKYNIADMSNNNNNDDILKDKFFKRKSHNTGVEQNS